MTFVFTRALKSESQSMYDLTLTLDIKSLSLSLES